MTETRNHTHGDRCGLWHPLSPLLITAVAMKLYSVKFDGGLDLRDDGSVNSYDVHCFLIDLLTPLEPADEAEAARWQDAMFDAVQPLMDALVDFDFIAYADEPESDEYWAVTFPDPHGWATNWGNESTAATALGNIAFDMLLSDRLAR